MSRLGCPNKISTKVVLSCSTCNKSWLDYPSRVGRRQFCSQRCGALSRVEALRERSIGNSWGGLRKMTDELRAKISLAHKGKLRPNISLSKLGDKNPNWRGGITPENKRIRMSAQFKEWRKKVFERDNYSCQECGERGGELHPDHIKQFAYFPELRFANTNDNPL